MEFPATDGCFTLRRANVSYVYLRFVCVRRLEVLSGQKQLPLRVPKWVCRCFCIPPALDVWKTLQRSIIAGARQQKTFLRRHSAICQITFCVCVLVLLFDLRLICAPDCLPLVHHRLLTDSRGIVVCIYGSEGRHLQSFSFCVNLKVSLLLDVQNRVWE